MKVEIELNRDGESNVIEYDYARRAADEKPMILDVLSTGRRRGGKSSHR